MDISNLIQILNNGIPAEALGGISSTIIIDLFNRVKNLFKNKKINEDILNEIYNQNQENEKLIQELVQELSRQTISVNKEGKLEIKNLFINSTFNNSTFN